MVLITHPYYCDLAFGVVSDVKRLLLYVALAVTSSKVNLADINAHMCWCLHIWGGETEKIAS